MSISQYTPIKYREELNTRLFYFILDLIPKIPKEKENRMVILRQKLVQYAQSELAVRILIAWNNDSYAALKDHQMSTVQKWSTVVKAFTQRGIDQGIKDKLLAERNELDKSDTGKLKNATCKSLAANKE